MITKENLKVSIRERRMSLHGLINLFDAIKGEKVPVYGLTGDEIDTAKLHAVCMKLIQIENSLK